jgi:hypothetical protein
MAQGFTLISSLAWTYHITPAKLPDRQPAVNLGHEPPGGRPGDRRPPISRRGLSRGMSHARPRNPSLGLHPSRIAQDAV